MCCRPGLYKRHNNKNDILQPLIQILKFFIHVNTWDYVCLKIRSLHYLEMVKFWWLRQQLVCGYKDHITDPKLDLQASKILMSHRPWYTKTVAIEMCDLVRTLYYGGTMAITAIKPSMWLSTIKTFAVAI